MNYFQKTVHTLTNLFSRPQNAENSLPNFEGNQRNFQSELSDLKTLAAKATSKKDLQTILSRLERMSTTRSRQDIKKWLSAVNQAEDLRRPRLQPLFELYRQTDLDEHLTAITGQRTKAVTGAQWRISDANGETNADLSKAIQDSTWFGEFLDEAMKALFWGYGMVELKKTALTAVSPPLEGLGEAIEVLPIPMPHINPLNRNIVLSQGDEEGIAADDTEYNIIELGKPYQLGLYMKATPAVIFTRTALAAWADYSEVFGSPMRVGKTDSQNVPYLNSFENFLKNMGSMPFALISKEDDIEFSNDSRADAFNVYDKLIDRHEKRLSKLILEQTGTTDEKAFVGGAEVHERVADKIAKHDKRNIAAIINTKLLPLLARMGFPVEGAKFEWIEIIPITKLDLETDQFLIDNFEFENVEHFSTKYKVAIKGFKVQKTIETPLASKKP
jgi:phage gp29-like protein